jgi:cystathionine beta-lyase
MAFLRAGDHLLMVDSAYSPTRKLCDGLLRGFGIETTYYDPLIGAKIARLIRPETRVVFCESPGSLTFEVQDIPAIAKMAHAGGAVVVLDNSWATPLLFEPFAHGVDVVIEAGTKYLVGHSDAMIGAIVTTEEHYRRVKTTAAILGAVPGPDDCYLALRGIRTLPVRLARHQETGLILARWLKRRREVALVLHPAFADCPGHRIWKRDFSGASGLFSIVLAKPYTKDALARMLDGMELFKMGYSWGGYESLILPADPSHFRTAVPWKAPGPLIRLHAGLEDPDDLIADLAAGFRRLARA